MAALYKGEAQISVLTNEDDQPVDTSWLGECVYLGQKCYLDTKRCGYEISGENLSWNEFDRNMTEIGTFLLKYREGKIDRVHFMK